MPGVWSGGMLADSLFDCFCVSVWFSNDSSQLVLDIFKVMKRFGIQTPLPPNRVLHLD